MFIKRLLAVYSGLLLSAWAYADDSNGAPKAASKIFSSVDMLQWLLALFMVLAVFFGLIWLLRKSGGLGLINKGQLAVITGLSLGMREKLVLVKVGEKQLLLGVTAGRIDKLLELEGEQRLFQTSGPEKELTSFKNILSDLVKNKADA